MTTFKKPDEAGVGRGTAAGIVCLPCIMPTLLFKPEGREVLVEPGETILDAALDNDIAINHDCGGFGACATCHVIVEKGLETLHDKTDEELDMLEFAEGVTENSRLACQCEIADDMVLVIPEDE